MDVFLILYTQIVWQDTSEKIKKGCVAFRPEHVHTALINQLNLSNNERSLNSFSNSSPTCKWNSNLQLAMTRFVLATL